MKGVCTYYFLCIITLLAASTAFGQTANYRSITSGAWGTPGTWERDVDLDGIFEDTPSTVAPTASTAGTITIQNGHNVNVAATVAIDQTTVQNGGTLTVDATFTLNLSSGTGNEITVDAGGNLINNGTIGFVVASARQVAVNGTYSNSGNNSGLVPGELTFGSGATYNHDFTDGGTIPVATWDANSNIVIRGYGAGSTTPPSNRTQNFGNFFWNCPNQDENSSIDLAGQPASVQGDFIIENTGTGSVIYAGSGTPSLNVGDDFIVNGGVFLFSVAGTTGTGTINITGDLTVAGGYVQFADDQDLDINVTGNFSFTAGDVDFAATTAATNLNLQGNFTHSGGNIFASGGAFNANFVGASLQTYSSSSVPTGTFNYVIDTGSTVEAGSTSFFAGTGTFTLSGTLRVRSTHASGAIQTGTANGNIRVSGARTYNSGSSIVYNGTAAQFLGNGHPSASGVNCEINNALGVSLAANATIGGNLTLTSGNLSVGTRTLTLNGSLTPNSNFINVSSTSNLTINGTGAFGSLATTGSTTINNLTINRTSGSVTLAADLTIGGTFTQTAGDIDLNGRTLTIGGVYSRTSGGIDVDASATLVVNGSGALPSNVAFSGTQVLNTLTLNRASTALGTNSTLTVTNLNLTAGTLNNSGTLTMAANGVITRTDGTITNNSPTTATSYDIVYDGASDIPTEAEIPALTSQLRHLSKTGGGILTLAEAITINGNLTLTNGSFNASTFAVDLKGNFVANAGSTLTSSPFTFSGTTSISGGSPVRFAAVTVTGSMTPTIDIRIDGNLVNNGTLNAGSGAQTVTFGGATTISGSSTSSFNNILISGTLTAPTGNFNVAGTWTNNGTFNRGADSNTVTFTGTSSIAGSSTTAFSGITISGTLTAPSILNVAGNFTNNGTFTAGTGTLVINGSVAQSISGTTVTNFNNITISKSSGTATVSTDQNITNTLTLTGGVLNANGRLTLVSTASGDARIAEITGGASITGNIIAQRYLPNASGGNVYRYLASPTTNAFVSEWKDDFPITGTFSDPSTQAEWPGLNVTSTARTMFWYNEAHTPTTTADDRYETYPPNGTASTAAALVNGRGYSARVRQTTPITIDVTGTPRQGDAPVSVTAQSAGGNDGWNLIGNPYAAPINWDNVTRPGAVNAQIAMMDNTNNIGLGAGQYVYYTQGSPGTGIPASYTGTIASGQAFWVRATANATITFQENDKEAVSAPDFIRQGSLEDILRVRIAGNSRQDEIVIRFADNASDKADNSYDAFKLANQFINLSSFSSDSLKMAINVLGGLNCNKEVGLVVDGVAPGSYAFTFTQFESFTDNVSIRLLDTFTGTTFAVTEQDPSYEFSVTADARTFGEKRFKVYFTYPTVTTDLELKSADVCSGTDAAISVENSQKGIRYYATINGSTVGDEVTSNGGKIELLVPHDQLGNGENNVVLMASVAGCSAVPLNKTVTIRTDKIYEITAAKGSKNCGQGQLTLSVEGAPADGSYHWYETADGTSPIAGQTGAVFTTPELTKTKTYYASAVNALGCEGQRKAVTAEVVPYDDVTITMHELQLTSSYASGNQWFFNGEPVPEGTGQSLTVTETGLYEVEVSINGCTTRASQEMIVLGTEGHSGKGYTFYPNPVQDQLYIELADPGPASGTVQTSLGQPVGTLKFDHEGAQVKGVYNFAHQPSGVYLIRVFQNNKIVHFKIIRK